MSQERKRRTLTDAELDRLADEAEAGYAPDRISPRPGRPRLSAGEGPSAVVNVRLDDELHRRLQERASGEERSVSEVVRDALRSHLAPSRTGRDSSVD